MEKYIKKSDIVAEIKTRIETYNKGYANGDDCRADALETFLHDIDFLEMKGVDLDKERRKYLTEHFNVYEDGVLQSKRSCMPLDTFDIIQVASHFYGLGLTAQKGE